MGSSARLAARQAADPDLTQSRDAQWLLTAQVKLLLGNSADSMLLGIVSVGAATLVMWPYLEPQWPLTWFVLMLAATSRMLSWAN